jgi:MHS family proline/betaine transporter-like MFS transporter
LIVSTPNNKQAHMSYKRTIVTGIAGNLMEWYDFAIYGYMVPVLSTLFFPSEDRVASIIATFSVFAAGYFARPVGGVIFGHIGDKYGRKLVLTLSVMLMGLSTFAIGLLPVHSQIGASAAGLLVVLRILQGMSVGGEYTGSITFVLEHSKPSNRALSTSWIGVGASLGFLIGSGVGTIMMDVFSQQELQSWAWRLPFLGGIFIAIAGWIIRRHAPEPPRPKDLPMESSPVLVAFRDHWRPMLQVVGLALAVNAGFYMMFVYANTYLTEHMHFSTSRAMTINTITLFILTAMIPLAGWLADRVGRKPVLLAGSLALIFLSWPLFWMMHHPTDSMIFLAQVGFALIIALIWGANPATMAELLPLNVRVSAFSIAYSVCLAIFGGTTPLIAAYLLQRTADDFSPVWYLIGLSVISLIAVLSIPETRPGIRQSQ